ncbi:MAG: monovalent cation/H+ antiporter complex subunit F [Spirochaetota bacterium]
MVNPLFTIATMFVLVSIVLATIRLLVGPTGLDRAVALDALTIVSVSLMAVIALSMGRSIYLDVTLVYALVSFLGVVALARYLERGLS